MLSDGTLVTFGEHNFRRFKIDDEIWWRRHAPEALLDGLRSLRSRLATDPEDD